MSENCSIESKPKPFKEFIKTKDFWLPFSGLSLGILGGFLYYYYIGCNSGTCPITSNPYISMIWGGAIGFFLTRRGGCGC